MWLAYTIGALLVLGGIALIGTLLWRRGPNGFATDGDEPQQYGMPIPQDPFANADSTARDPAAYRQFDADEA
jgi:hypothetical protein